MNECMSIWMSVNTLTTVLEYPHCETLSFKHSYSICYLARGSRSWHLPGKPKLVWHPARLRNEWGCVDISMDTLHLRYWYPLVLFGSLVLHFFLSPRTIMLCHCSSTVTKDHFLHTSYGTKWPLCVCVPLHIYSFILSIKYRSRVSDTHYAICQF